jgi:hypothetical protein
MKAAKRSFCGEFKKPDHAFKSKAFKGRHSRTTAPDVVAVRDANPAPDPKPQQGGGTATGKPQTGGASPGQVVQPPPVQPQAPPPATGGGGVDPEAYDPGANVNPNPNPAPGGASGNGNGNGNGQP